MMKSGVEIIEDITEAGTKRVSLKPGSVDTIPPVAQIYHIQCPYLSPILAFGWRILPVLASAGQESF